MNVFCIVGIPEIHKITHAPNSIHPSKYPYPANKPIPCYRNVEIKKPPIIIHIHIHRERSSLPRQDLLNPTHNKSRLRRRRRRQNPSAQTLHRRSRPQPNPSFPCTHITKPHGRRRRCSRGRINRPRLQQPQPLPFNSILIASRALLAKRQIDL